MLLMLGGGKGATASNSWPAVQSSLEGKMGERKSAVLDILPMSLPSYHQNRQPPYWTTSAHPPSKRQR